MSDMSVIRDYERKWLDPDYEADDYEEDDEYWNRADDEAEELWLERNRDGRGF